MSKTCRCLFRGVIIAILWITCGFSNGLSAMPPDGDITVTSPNGGESWAQGSSHNITWNAPGITSGQFRIYLFDGDTNLGTIAMYLPASQDSFNWTVGHLIDAPDVGAGGNYKIKIRIMSEAPMDFSDAPFTITSSSPPPSGSIRVTSPNGGESWAQGSSHNITWNAPGISSGTFRITLLKGGTPVGTVATGLAASQDTFNWNVGDMNAPFPGAGANYRIQIEHQGGTELDFSDGPFVISQESSQPPPAVRRDGVSGEAAFIDLVLTRVFVSGDKLAVGVANRGNRDITSSREVPFAVWINQESGPPTIRLRRPLTVPAGGSTVLQLLPVNPQWCPTCCGVPVSVAVNRGHGALPETNIRNNVKMERIFLKRRDWRLVPLILLGSPGGGKRIINPRTQKIVVAASDGRVRGEWGQGASLFMSATFRIKNCGNYEGSSIDPHYTEGRQMPKITIQVYQKGVWETVQVRGADGILRPQTRYNPNKIRFAGGQTFFQVSIPIGQDAPVDLPVTLIHPGDHPSSLVFLFKDFRKDSWGILGIQMTSSQAVFNRQRMEFPLEFR